MNIRLGNTNDIADCLKIYNDQIAFEEVNGDLTGWRKDVYPTADDIENGIAAGDFYVLEEDGVVLACGRINHVLEPHYQFIKWQIEEWDAERILVLHTLAVAQDAKRRGVGAAFLKFYEDEGKRQNCRTLRFDTVSTNLPAQSFYKKHGYTECGRYPGNYMGRSDILYVCLEKIL